MVSCVIDDGWNIEATAERFQVDAKTVRKWRDRFLAEGSTGLLDRSSRPHRSASRTRRSTHKQVLRLRCKRRWGADRIAFEVGIAASTVRRVLRAEGCARLDRGDRATDRTPVRRYQRERPGELIHVDVKKLASIPTGGGWRFRGKGYEGQFLRNRGHGYRYIHSALDDRSRIVYSEVLDYEQATTAAAFWARAAAWFATIGIRCERVITDNGSCYKSGLWHRACATTGTIVKRTRPRRPQTNGKVERYHRILLEEWAYIRPWTSERQRAPSATTASSTSTITTDPTARSAGQHPTPPAGTSSPLSTTSRQCVAVRAEHVLRGEEPVLRPLAHTRCASW
jgi:transposase